MKEINEILMKTNILKDCENKYQNALKEKNITFSASLRQSEYTGVITKKINTIRDRGWCDLGYISLNDEISDLEKAKILLKANAQYLYDSDKDT